MKIQDIILIALICASTMLAGLLIATQLGTATPVAFGQTCDRSGDYIIITGHISTSLQGVMVIDTVAERANFYIPVSGKRQFTLVDSRDLAKDFRPQ